MPVKHATTKSAGERLYAVTDWNADHVIEGGLDLGDQDITLTGAIGRDSDNQINWNTDDTLTIKVGGSSLDITGFATGTSDNNQLVTKGYVDENITIQDLDFAGDSGTGSVDLDSQTFTIAGTENQISTSASGQTLTLSLPQDISTTSSPEFAGLTLSGNLVSSSDLSIQLNSSTADTTLTIENTDSSHKANLSVEGDLSVGESATVNSSIATPLIKPTSDGATAIQITDTSENEILSVNTSTPALNIQGNLNVYGDIYQEGEVYETHAEQLYTSKDMIITRDGATAGLGVGEYTGIQAHLYDGTNDGQLVFDKDGWARVGDVGDLQKLATIEESPTNQGIAFYDTTDLQLKTSSNLTFDSNSGILSLTGNLIVSGDLTVDTDTLYVDSTNDKVGIGTTSPATVLNIIGVGATEDSVRIADSAGTRAELGYHDNDGRLVLFKADGTSNVLLTSDGDSYLMGGNVGIGTTSPSSKFVVTESGDSTDDYFVVNPQNGGNRKLTIEGAKINVVASSTEGVQPLLLQTNGGNVGIGTTDPDAILHTKGDLVIFEDTNSGTAVKINPASLNTPEITFHANDDSKRFSVIADMESTTDDDVLKFQEEGNDVLAITGTGNVGIGTTEPDKKLHVVGDIKVSDVAGAVPTFELRETTTDHAWYVNIEDGNVFNIKAGPQYAISIPTSGYVGIGVTNPTRFLTVKGSIRNENSGAFPFLETVRSDAVVSGGYIYKEDYYGLISGGSSKILGNIYVRVFGSAGSETSSYTIRTMDSGSLTEALVVKGDQVGIGTNDPTSNLHIYNIDGTAEIRSQAGGNNISRAWFYNGNYSYGFGIGTASTGYIWKNISDPTVVMSFTPAGNVGIGTDNPDGLLELQKTDSNTDFVVRRAGTNPSTFKIKAQANLIRQTFSGDLHFDIDESGTTALLIQQSTGNVGIGTNDPQTLLSLPNDEWISGENNAGTGVVNMFKVNTNDEIEVGGTLNLGTIEAEEDSGAITLFNMPVSSSSNLGDEMSASLSIDSEPILKVYSTADGTGGIDEKGLIFHVQNGAINSDALNNNECVAYLDESSNSLIFKVKYSNGTVKTGTVSLS